MTFFLQFLKIFDALVFCGVKQEERGDSVGKDPQHDRDEGLCQGDGKQDRVGNEFEKVHNNAIALSYFVAGEFRPCLVFVQFGDPLGVAPQIFAALHKGVFCFFEDELELEVEGFLLGSKQFGLHFIHFLVLQQPISYA